MRALQKVGVPYTDAEIADAAQSIRQQADEIVGRLKQANVTTPPDREIIALIAYLQRLGKDGRAAIAAGETAPKGVATAAGGRTP
jgi:cytochrome c oxidase cbb3-type subunit I/II